MRNLVVMVSIGVRPWATSTAATFERYCKNIGADFLVQTTLPSQEQFPLPPLADSPGRKNKASYASKTYFAYEALARYNYDRVLVVDDTCVVWPKAENIFNLVPFGSLGYTISSSRHAETSFASIVDFCTKQRIDVPTYRAALYMNSGVILYDRTFQNKISSNEIINASELLYSRYPHQTLLFFLVLKNRIRATKIDKSWNIVPKVDVYDDERQSLRCLNKFIDFDARDWNILHLTGGSFNHRHEIAESLARHVLKVC